MSVTAAAVVAPSAISFTKYRDVAHSASGNAVCPDQAPAYGMFMPDVIKSITIDGTYYFLTANEGGGRDGEDMIGISGDFEGEEIRMKDLETSCGTGDDDCSGDAELGRVKVTTFMPSNYATNTGEDISTIEPTLGFNIKTLGCAFLPSDPRAC